MNLLLDTHVVIWWVDADPRIKTTWLEAIVDDSNTVFVSAASAWEIEIKKRQGRLPFEPTVVEVADQYGFELLPISVSDAVTAGSLDWGHSDPFDRMLAAQAIDHSMKLVTGDAAFATAPGIRIL